MSRDQESHAPLQRIPDLYTLGGSAGLLDCSYLVYKFYAEIKHTKENMTFNLKTKIQKTFAISLIIGRMKASAIKEFTLHRVTFEILSKLYKRVGGWSYVT